MVIADYEVANFYKNHYQTAHQDQIQTDQHYHQSYILANIESIAPSTSISAGLATQSLFPVSVSQGTNPNQIPVHAQIATEVPVELVQVQEPVMYYSDWFNTVPVPVTVQPASSQNIQIIQPNQIQILQFEPASVQNIGHVTELEDQLLLSKKIHQKLPDQKNCSVRVAKKSLPGVVPPKAELEGELKDEEDLVCFICGPKYKFETTDQLQLHCNLQHEMAAYVESIAGTLNGEKKKLIKCQFCSYRSLEKKRYLKHLMAYHSPEDIYIKCLHLQARKLSRGQPIRMKRSHKDRRARETKISLNCSLCDHFVQGDISETKEKMKKHLIEDHNIIRNIDLGISHCLPSIYTPVT